MTYVLGVGIGTSRTAAALARVVRGGPVLPEQLSLAPGQDSVPSVVCVSDDGQALVGEAAERRGPEGSGRLIRGSVRPVGDEVPLIAGQLSLLPEQLFATVARWVLARAEEQEGSVPAAVVASHPAAQGPEDLQPVNAMEPFGEDPLSERPGSEADSGPAARVTALAESGFSFSEA
jgi:molecular chaperone DnaK (HSP70)